MFLRVLLAIFLACTAGRSLAAEAAPSNDLHHLALRVLHDGVPAFSPRLSVRQGRTATVALEGRHGQRYSLVVDIAEAEAIAGEAGADLQWSLWQDGTLLQEGALTISPAMVQAAALEGRPLGVRKRGLGGGQVDVQLLDHSVEASPLGGDGRATACAIASPMATARDKGCCAAKCQDGSGQSLKCCGASSCCACGTCCHVP